jgi:hypothetical protein
MTAGSCFITTLCEFLLLNCSSLIRCRRPHRLLCQQSFTHDILLFGRSTSNCGNPALRLFGFGRTPICSPSLFRKCHLFVYIKFTGMFMFCIRLQQALWLPTDSAWATSSRMKACKYAARRSGGFFCFMTLEVPRSAFDSLPFFQAADAALCLDVALRVRRAQACY